MAEYTTIKVETIDESNRRNIDWQITKENSTQSTAENIFEKQTNETMPVFCFRWLANILDSFDSIDF